MLLVPLAQIGIYLAVLCNYALISTFILCRELTIECGVYFYITVFLTTSRTSFKTTLLLKTAAARLEFIAPVKIRLSNAASISHQTRNRLLPLGYSPLANSLPMCMKHRSNCDFASAILTTADCLCPTVRTFGTTKFFELFDVLVTLLQPNTSPE